MKERGDLATYTCRFGYGGSCVTVLACNVEGGQCAGSCVVQPEYELPTARSGAPSAQGGRTSAEGSVNGRLGTSADSFRSISMCRIEGLICSQCGSPDEPGVSDASVGQLQL